MTMRLAAVYIATVIGAGFASGREMVQFFAQYGWVGLIGLGAATFLLSYGGTQVLLYCKNNRITSYEELLQGLSGRLLPLVDLGYTILLLASVSIMIAGAEEAISYMGYPFIGRYVTAGLILVVLIKGTEGVLEVSSYIVPVLVLGMIILSLRSIRLNGVSFPPSKSATGLGAGVLYGTYNLGYAMAIFSGLSSHVKSQATAVKAGAFGGLILGLLATIITIALWGVGPLILDHPLPLVKLAFDWNPWVGLAYALILWGAMYTTALANGLALAVRMNRQGKILWGLSCFLVVISGLLLSYVGFVELVASAYPLFGYLGIYLLYQLLRFPKPS